LLNGALSKVAVTFYRVRVDTKTVDAERERLYQDKPARLNANELQCKCAGKRTRAAADAIEDASLRHNFLLAEVVWRAAKFKTIKKFSR